VRVALVSPLYETVPPTHYGGTERVIAALGDELVRRGHEVTLFAAQGSRTAARLEPMAAEPLRSTMSRTELERVAPHLHLGMLAEVYGRAAEFDVIHAHVDLLALPFAGLVDTPTLVTLHGRLDLAEVQRVLPTYENVAFASISDAQRTALAGAPVRWATIDLARLSAPARRGGSTEAWLASGRRSGAPPAGPASGSDQVAAPPPPSLLVALVGATRRSGRARSAVAPPRRSTPPTRPAAPAPGECRRC